MRILSLEPDPVELVRYLNATRRGGSEVCRLPILRGRAQGLPEGLDAVVATSDLQGVVQSPGKEPELLGVAVARRCAELMSGRALAVLAGDLYSVPDATRRGGYGDVASVWAAFAQRFERVVGVAGNHDDTDQIALSERVHVLDMAQISLGGLTLGGVGRVIGDPGKPGRREREEQLATVELVAEAGPDVLILHEGPPGDGEGTEEIAEILARHPVPLVICGHVHWPAPLWERSGRQVLNVDGRAVILTR